MRDEILLAPNVFFQDWVPPPLPRQTGILYFFFVEHSFECPYCGEEISMVLDTSVARQTYIEDCEVCCRPIEITYVVEDGELVEFGAKALE